MGKIGWQYHQLAPIIQPWPSHFGKSVVDNHLYKDQWDHIREMALGTLH